MQLGLERSAHTPIDIEFYYGISHLENLSELLGHVSRIRALVFREFDSLKLPFVTSRLLDMRFPQLQHLEIPVLRFNFERRQDRVLTTVDDERFPSLNTLVL